MRKLKIFCAIQNWNWELPNFIEPLRDMGHEVIWYDWKAKGYDQYSKDWESLSKDQMNRELFDLVKSNNEKKPIDLFFGYLSDPVINTINIKEIKLLGIPTLNFSCNDIFTFDRGHRETAPIFDLNWTTNEAAVVNYKAVNAKVICTPYGINTKAYSRPYCDYNAKGYPRYLYDVSFVGQLYGYRLALFSHLMDQSLKLSYGLLGRIPFQSMINTFSRSKINISFSGTPGGNLYDKTEKMLRFRDFEVPAIGELYMTERCDFIQDLYEEDKEMLFYETVEEMVDKVVFYSKDENRIERQKIAIKGYKKCLNEYNFKKVFSKVLDKMGLLE